MYNPIHTENDAYEELIMAYGEVDAKRVANVRDKTKYWSPGSPEYHKPTTLEKMIAVIDDAIGRMEMMNDEIENEHYVGDVVKRADEDAVATPFQMPKRTDPHYRQLSKLEAYVKLSAVVAILEDVPLSHPDFEAATRERRLVE